MKVNAMPNIRNAYKIANNEDGFFFFQLFLRVNLTLCQECSNENIKGEEWMRTRL